MKIIYLIFLLNLLSCKNEIDKVSENLLKLGFTEKKTPDISNNSLNNMASAYFVELKEKLHIKEHHELRPKIVFDNGDVKYIGIDNGEWGGGLYLNEYNNDLGPILQGNIRSLIPINNDLYIISGLTHFEPGQGAIHVIRNYHKPSKPIKITLLPDSPEAVVFSKTIHGEQKIIIAGYHSLIEFIPDSNLKIIVFKAFWKDLYPNSIIEYEGEYIIGIRSGIAVVKDNFNDANVRYFKPN